MSSRLKQGVINMGKTMLTTKQGLGLMESEYFHEVTTSRVPRQKAKHLGYSSADPASCDYTFQITYLESESGVDNFQCQWTEI